VTEVQTEMLQKVCKPSAGDILLVASLTNKRLGEGNGTGKESLQVK
jgi:hypothetical protein